MAMFNSYVKLPEGKEPSGPRFAGLCQPAAVRGGHGLGWWSGATVLMAPGWKPLFFLVEVCRTPQTYRKVKSYWNSDHFFSYFLGPTISLNYEDKPRNVGAPHCHTYQPKTLNRLKMMPANQSPQRRWKIRINHRPKSGCSCGTGNDARIRVLTMLEIQQRGNECWFAIRPSVFTLQQNPRFDGSLHTMKLTRGQPVPRSRSFVDANLPTHQGAHASGPTPRGDAGD
jgi:hypothetical protein